MIRAHVTDQHYGIGVQIAIVLHPPEGAADTRPRVMSLAGGMPAWSQEVEPLAQVQPTAVLDDDCARALLDGLMRYYHGAEDTRALRRDYDDERGRVDKLTDAVIGLAHGRGDEP